MKFVVTLVGLVLAGSSALAESRTTTEGVIAVCQCNMVDDGLISQRGYSSNAETPARSHDEARRYAYANCKNLYKGGMRENVEFNGECTYSKAIRQESRVNKKEKVKFRIEKLTGDEEANLQADLMSTLNN